MSCTSNGCRLAKPDEALALLCAGGCRIERRQPARPTPPPEPPATKDQIAAEDSLFGVLQPVSK